MGTRKIGVDPEVLRDLLDLAGIANFVQTPVRCPSGRFIAQGYVCHICGVDTSVVIERDGKKYRQCGAKRAKNVTRKMTEEIGSVLPVIG